MNLMVNAASPGHYICLSLNKSHLQAGLQKIIFCLGTRCFVKSACRIMKL
jgi:hypothetical protein